MYKHLLVILFGLFFAANACKKDSISNNPVIEGFTSFSFLKEHNPDLDQDVHLIIDGSTLYTNHYPHFKLKKLVASYSFFGSSIEVNLTLQENEVTLNDFTDPVTYHIRIDANSIIEYQVILKSQTNLPLITINTENNEEVLTKDEYHQASLKFESAEFENFSTNIRIRARGNTTLIYPKKPYQIKFNEKTAWMGMPKDKKWIFLANHLDKTMLRNELGFILGRLSNLEWTPQTHFVDLTVNNKYRGTYQVTQKIEETKNRIDLGDDDFLLEIDSWDKIKNDDVYFSTDSILFVIKEPNIAVGDANFDFIEKHIKRIDTIIYGPNFKDPNIGYSSVLDVQSFIDWYLINELAKNIDAKFRTSVYMTLRRGGKLKMGPLWDFDIGFGNHGFLTGNPEGFWIKNSVWINRLFQDPVFVEQVNERFKFFLQNKNFLINELRSQARNLEESQPENNLVWNVIGADLWPNPVFFDTYDEEVNHLISWLELRFDWMETALAEL